ncbi:selenium metabolism-associated LysR family transcriptional regulator [uncultured Marinococcus sp.]|uniref:selenium metabolism-associated LysR family transcriptional regulator n=1 Tax=uncultured Marinococcus sp. TaxID=487012 RepID=UPI002623AE24|nr:selenium metabolism-associated LysR family transcriptional regulator [uncultured Marinococcus sp.]
MNFEYIKTFYTLANCRNFSETAKALYLSQPSVTSQIKSLEQYLGTKLFTRTHHSVELTLAGEILYPYAEDIINMSTKAENEIGKLAKKLQGKLLIASSLTIGESILPSYLNMFKTHYPNVKLETVITNSKHVIEMIQRNEIELGLIEAEFDEPSFITQSFMEDELVLFGNQEDCAFLKEPIDLKEITRLPLILREQGSGTRSVAEKYLKHHQIDPKKLNIVLELDSTESIKSAVEAHLGFSILSKSAIRKELNFGLFQNIAIKNSKFTRTFKIIYKKNRQLSLISEKFLELILSSSEETGR